MYTLPNRPVQHLNEQKSLAILLYSLRDKGIVRSITSNDYGIDLEYEFVENKQVTGKIIKIQLKAKDSFHLNKDKTITISKIKQSTLRYWAEISFSNNVVLVVVDLKSESIFVSKPVFWDAITLIDNTSKTKSIKLSAYKEPKTISPILIDSFALIPNITEIKLYHKILLQLLQKLIEEYYFSETCDYDCELIENNYLDMLLEISYILLWNVFGLDKEITKVDNKYKWYKKDAYRCEYGAIRYKDVNNLYKILLSHLLKFLKITRIKMMNSFIFWICKDKEYYKFVISYEIDENMLNDYKKFEEFKQLRNHEVLKIIEDQIKQVKT